MSDADTKETETRDPNGPPEGANRVMRMGLTLAITGATLWVAVRFADQSEIPMFVALSWIAVIAVKLARNGLDIPEKERLVLVHAPFSTTMVALLLTGAVGPPGTERHVLLRETLLPGFLWMCLALFVLGAVWWQGLLILRGVREEWNS